MVKRNQSGSAQRKPQTLSTIVRYEILAHFELIANNICDNFFYFQFLELVLPENWTDFQKPFAIWNNFNDSIVAND